MIEHPRRHDARRILPLLPGMIPANIVQNDSVVPVEWNDGCLVVAVLESCSDEVLDKVMFICNVPLEVAIVSEEAMRYAKGRYLGPRGT